MPSETTLRAAYEANPHGCGFVSPSLAYKGMSFKKLLKRLKRVPTDEPCLMHFRLATHGSICKENCHPYNFDDVWFMHNGILDVKPFGDLTDSETAFLQYFAPAIHKYGYHAVRTDEIINHYRGSSRFAFMRGHDVRLFGEYYRRNDNCYYSNLRFEAYLPYYKALEQFDMFR